MIDFYSDNDLQHINDNLDKIEEDAIKQSYKILDPNNEEYEKVRNVILDFIKKEKKIVYGGSSYNAIIQKNNKTVGIYKEFERYDIEFYSANPINDMIAICNKLNDIDIKYVIGRQAQHDETFTVFANFNQYCDMSYMPKIIYDKMEFIEIDGIRYVHPNYILIDIFRMYNDPLTSFWRLPKVFKRMKLLMSEYKFDFKSVKKVKFEKLKNHSNIIDYIVPKIVEKFKSIVFVGQLAYQLYVNPEEQIDSKNINQIEIICDNPVEVGKYIKSVTYNWLVENDKKLLEKYDDIFSIKFFNRFFQYWAPRSVIYYNNEPIFTIIGNMGRCIPYNKLTINNNIDLYVGSFLVTFNYFFIGQHYEKIINNGFYYADKNIADSMLTERNEYLSKNGKNVLDATIYKEFVINCIGDTKNFSRESLLKMNERKNKGLKPILSYDPNVNRGAYLAYEFEISDGTESTYE